MLVICLELCQTFAYIPVSTFKTVKSNSVFRATEPTPPHTHTLCFLLGLGSLLRCPVAAVDVWPEPVDRARGAAEDRRAQPLKPPSQTINLL